MRISPELTPGQWALVEGDGRVADSVAQELKEASGVPPKGDPIFRFTVTDDSAPAVCGPSFAGVRAVPGGVAWRAERMDYDLVVSSSPPLSIVMHIGRRGPPFGIPAAAFPFVERTAMSWVEAQAYHAVLSLEFFALMCGQVGVLHASAVESDGSALVLTSAGGVGKTTAACRLVAGAGFRHLTDDILLVNPDGRCTRSARKVMVYPYNVADVPGLKAAVRGAARRSHLLWELDRVLGIGRRRRRVGAQVLFGDVGGCSQVEVVVLLRRAAEPAIRLCDVRSVDLASRVNQIVISEYAQFMDFLRLSAALLGEEFWWSPDRLATRNSEVLQQVFARARRLCIADIGRDFDPTSALGSLMSQ